MKPDRFALLKPPHDDTIRPLEIGVEVRGVSALKEVRCGKCQKLLFRGTLIGEIKCRGCGHMNRWG